jgi:glycosyltransferase involved in cell wall biosynthesis
VRLLVITDFVASGGAERQLVLLLAGLADHVECRLVTLGDGALTEAARHSGLAVKTVPRRFRADLTPAWVISREIAHWRPSVVHGWGWMSVAAAGPICKVLGIPLVDGSIRTGMLPARRLMRLRRIPGRLFASKVVANSQAGMDAFGIGVDKGTVIPNGFDSSRLHDGRPLSARASSPGFTVVMTGSMYPGKDFSTLIEAARRFAGQIDGPCRFVLAGDGSDRPRLVRLSRDLTEAGVLEIRERVNDVTAFEQGADVGVLLADPRLIAEGCANSILEYMACGLPVIATNSGGNPEVVKDGVNGFLVEPCNPDAIVEALLTLYTTPALAKRLGEEGRRAVETVFSAEAMVRSYRRLYDELTTPRQRVTPA